MRTFSHLPTWAKFLSVFLALVFIVNSVWVGIVFYDENSDSAPARGGRYSEASVSTIHHLNPLLTTTTDAERDMQNLIFSGLMRYDTTTGEVVSDLAECKSDKQAVTYTCTLKKNITWQDNEPLTIEDVMYTYKDLIQNPALPNASLRSIFEKVVIEQPDEQTIKFTLPSSDAFFESELTIGIVPKHILKLVPVDNLELSDFNLKPIGSGPYKLDSIKKQDNQWEVHLSLFEQYYGEMPKIENLVLYYYPDYPALAKDISIFNGIKNIPSTEVKRFEADPRFNFYKYTLPQYVALFMNSNSNILRDPKVRYGLLFATNKGPIAEAALGEVIDTPYLDTKTSLDIAYSLERAKGILSDAGWSLPVNADGSKNLTATRTHKKDETTTETLDLTLLTADTPPLYEQVARTVKAQWAEAGVNVNIKVLPSEEFRQAVLKREYDILLFGQNFGYNPDLLPFWHSSNAESGLNFSAFKDFTTDFMLEDARNELDPEERKENFTKIAKQVAGPIYGGDGVLRNGVAAIFLYTPDFHFVVDKKIQGITLGRLAYSADRFLSIGEWYVREEKHLRSDLSFGKVWAWFVEKLTFSTPPAVGIEPDTGTEKAAESKTEDEPATIEAEPAPEATEADKEPIDPKEVNSSDTPASSTSI